MRDLLGPSWPCRPRPDWLWADRTPLPPTLGAEFDVGTRALPYIGL